MSGQASVGQTLQARREVRGLTPEQAAFQCKVPIRLLQALEADDYRLLPDATYLVRLLHDYARLLGLEPTTLEAEFRRAIRRPPGATLAVVPAPAPPMIAWTQVLWTAVAILFVTPLVFIALSLASKRAAERPVPPMGGQRAVEETTPVEGESAALVDRLLAWRLEPTQAGVEAISGEILQPQAAFPSIGGQATWVLSEQFQTHGLRPALSPLPGLQAPLLEQPPRRFLLTAQALEQTWMTVRADTGQERQVLLQKGETAHFVADIGFVITVGNAGGVNISLNGKALPSLGGSGQIIRSLAIPPIDSSAKAQGDGASTKRSGRRAAPE